MKYTEKQIDIAMGIISGRINPDLDLKYLEDAQGLYNGELKSMIVGGEGNPGTHAHYRQAERILMHLIRDKP
jgi:hypothetical protein